MRSIILFFRLLCSFFDRFSDRFSNCLQFFRDFHNILFFSFFYNILCFLFQIIKTMFVFFLLRCCQFLILHFQFHGFGNIFAFAKPQNQFITFFDTAINHTRFFVKTSQLVSPSLIILVALIFFQNCDLVCHRRTTFSVNLIF